MSLMPQMLLAELNDERLDSRLVVMQVEEVDSSGLIGCYYGLFTGSYGWKLKCRICCICRDW